MPDIKKKKKTPYGQEVGHESEVDAGILASSNQGVQVQWWDGTMVRTLTGLTSVKKQIRSLGLIDANY